MAALELTDSQKEQLRALREEHRSEIGDWTKGDGGGLREREGGNCRRGKAKAETKAGEKE